MPGATPTYGLPYQLLTDPPNGASLGQDLATEVEAELERIEARVQAEVVGPAAQTDYTSGLTTVVSVVVPVVAGRRYQVAGDLQGVQQTSTGIVNVTLDTTGTSGSLQGALTRLLWLASTPAGNTVYGNGQGLYNATATGNETFRVRVSSSAGALRLQINQARLYVTDLGT